ncbi:MAG: YdeI/OmpD-associated family protein [Actinomycetota bacterium]|nr:YdeI/OmpD-associated family protein [Actinomycetota bacterium]
MAGRPLAPELPIHAAATAADWEQWLGEQHAASPGVWLMIAKRGSDATSVSYPEALETAICFGWIDGQKRGRDERHWLQRFTPRGPRSRWSQINREAAEQLIAAGRMQPAGLRQVEAARADGRWSAAYPPQSSATVPDDFQSALDENPAARAFFMTLTGSPRYAFLYRLHSVRSPVGRRERIAGYIKRLNQGRTLD